MARQCTVLVVDPCPLERGMIAIALHSAGFRTLEAESGREALDAVKNCRVDLIVAQVEMDDFSGIELTRFVKADPRHAEIPVILRSSKRGAALRKEAFDAGAAGLRPTQESVGPLIGQIRELLQEQLTRSRRVVILRSSPELKTELRGALKESGLAVLDVGDPTKVGPVLEALDSLDLVFVDFRLSTRQAISFIRYVQDLSPSKNLRVVLLMSGIDVDQVVDEIRDGIDHYLVAPVGTDKVCDGLRALGLWKTVAQ